VDRAHGVNANQVFKWHRALKRGELNDAASPTSLLPVNQLTPSCYKDRRGEDSHLTPIN
jgi:transposase-like protein